MSVAVGVETRQDWDFLQGLGCTYAQGYHIANPMEASAFPGLAGRLAAVLLA
jgi:EAL domain-containing protein (putative c-di-GMP-specific phosphodiesterase class I)